jgi:hypothetical protein
MSRCAAAAGPEAAPQRAQADTAPQPRRAVVLRSLLPLLLLGDGEVSRALQGELSLWQQELALYQRRLGEAVEQALPATQSKPAPAAPKPPVDPAFAALLLAAPLSAVEQPGGRPLPQRAAGRSPRRAPPALAAQPPACPPAHSPCAQACCRAGAGSATSRSASSCCSASCRTSSGRAPAAPAAPRHLQRPWPTQTTWTCSPTSNTRRWRGRCRRRAGELAAGRCCPGAAGAAGGAADGCRCRLGCLAAAGAGRR